jgi:uncharacterized protein YjbI with pentapeptide repeats
VKNVEVQKVLKMNKEGTITDEQAAELIDELTRRGSGPAQSGEGIADVISSLIGKTVDGAVSLSVVAGHSTSHVTGFAPNDLQNNEFHMSKVEGPKGEGYVFRGNQVRMSHVKPMRLERAELTDNRIDASKVEELVVIDGKLSGSLFQASAVDGFKVENARVAGAKLLSSKLSGFEIAAESSVEDVKLNASAIKRLSILDRSEWASTSISGAKIKDLRIVGSKLSGVDAQAVQISGTNWIECTLAGVFLRGTQLDKTTFTRCKLKEVVFSGGEASSWKNWSKNGLTGVEFENVELDQVLFADCHWKRVVVKNVKLKDVRIEGVRLADVTIDGNEAFLEAIKKKD